MAFVCLDCGNMKKFKVFYSGVRDVEQEIDGDLIMTSRDDRDEEMTNIVCQECGSTNCLVVDFVSEIEDEAELVLGEEKFREFLQKFRSRNNVNESESNESCQKLDMKEKVGE